MLVLVKMQLGSGMADGPDGYVVYQWLPPLRYQVGKGGAGP